MSRKKNLWLGAGIGLGIVTILSASSAEAHFVLRSPDASLAQSELGDPQKEPPCGGNGVPTGTVTAYRQGQTITVTIDETIFHPGHYRIALATNSLSELPAEPLVTPDDSSACGSVPIQDPPIFPILADGVFKHTVPFTGPQSAQITLPANVTCETCTLQVLEFMSAHGAPCFYHHCATISIAASNPNDPDASVPTPKEDAHASPEADSGATSPATPNGNRRSTSDSDNSGCTIAHEHPTNAGRDATFSILVAAFAIARRRRATPR